MTTKEKLIGLLEDSSGEYLSGNAIADSLGITRAAVWKQIRQLEKDGYQIEAVTNKGYRLSSENDAVSRESILRGLKEWSDLFTVEFCSSLSSTNTVLKEKAQQQKDWHVLIAGTQTVGKGRSGRSFYSPPGTGIYLSVLLRPDVPVADAGKLTTAAAIAACRAIEDCTDEKPEIKWVNDVFVRQKKVCGILTEASVNFETGTADWIVVGIGFNVYEPEEGFPMELNGIAGAISDTRKKNLRSELSARFLIHFYKLCKKLSDKELYQEYRSRCFIPGKNIYVIKGDRQIPAFAEDINEDFSLQVRYEDGSLENLNAGEVSIRPGEKMHEQ